MSRLSQRAGALSPLQADVLVGKATQAVNNGPRPGRRRLVRARREPSDGLTRLRPTDTTTGAGRDNPGPVGETLVLITTWATLKLPQCSRLMEFRESADALRWAVGRTEPDVHLIKQVEQGTKSALEPTWRFARIPSMGVTDAVEILLFLVWQLLHWLLFGCKNSQNIQKRSGDLFAKRQSGQCCRP
jgi:hypothetical protein